VEPLNLPIVGDLDLATCGRVERALAAIDDRDVCLDMSQCTFIDSSGLMIIVRTYERLAQANKRLSVTGANGDVARVFELTGLVRLLTHAG
jgi:anti-anti-sigma factor